MRAQRNKMGVQTPNDLVPQELTRLGIETLARLIQQESETNPEFRSRVLQLIADIGAADGDDPSRTFSDEPHMVGNSDPMLRVFDAIRKIAVTDAPVLITGESGTGKELAALAVHERSSFNDGPFVAVNCAAIPGTLIASELFGHEKGAFTGAHQRKIGRVEAAQGGTLFLDEIGDLPTDLQAHLLRFLQEKTVVRLGGHRSVKIDARIIAATNQDLTGAIARGAFREDLFYRLNVLHIEMPPLRERGEDLDLISTYFLRKFAEEMHRPVTGFADGAMEAVRSYGWPGNVRELISSIRRAVVMAESPFVTVADLGLEGSAPGVTTAVNGRVASSGSDAAPRKERSAKNGSAAAEVLDADRIATVLEEHHNNVSRAAKALGVSRVTLYRHMRKHNIRNTPST